LIGDFWTGLESKLFREDTVCKSKNLGIGILK